MHPIHSHQLSFVLGSFPILLAVTVYMQQRGCHLPLIWVLFTYADANFVQSWLSGNTDFPEHNHSLASLPAFMSLLLPGDTKHIALI